MANVQDRGPPSAAAVAIGTAIISGLTGYFLGQASSIGLFGNSSTRSPVARLSHKNDESETSDGDSPGDASDDEDDSVQDLGELKTFSGNNEECKLVLVVRTDLGMGKGKIAAQCSHATLACYKTLVRADPAHPILKRWGHLRQAKVALKVDSEDDMLMLQAQAIASGSATVLGIGPAPKSRIDEVTGHLKLL